MSKVFRVMYKEYLDEYLVKIPCRLCEENWLLPKEFEEHFLKLHPADKGKMICCWCKDWHPDNGSVPPEQVAQHKMLCFRGYLIMHLRHDVNILSEFIKKWNKGLAEPEKPILRQSNQYKTQYKDFLQNCEVKLPCLRCDKYSLAFFLPKDTEAHWAKAHPGTKGQMTCCWCLDYHYKKSDPTEDVARHKLECLKHCLFTYDKAMNTVENSTIIRLIMKSSIGEEEEEKKTEEDGKKKNK